jgi:peptidyl-prolyl cis-trans isomerase C
MGHRIVWISLLCLAGCGPAGTPPEKVVAQVNRYTVTADEFRRELQASRRMIRSVPSSDRRGLAAGVLEKVIERQVLLEEAQTLGFDKKPEFMREVEAYWRQALLKALVNRKNEEFLSTTPVTDAEVSAAYAREGVELVLDFVVFADEASARSAASAGDAYEAVLTQLGSKVVLRSKTDGWSAGLFPEALEMALWALEPGALSPALFSPEDGWIVARVLEKKTVPVKPLEEMRDMLRARLATDRVQERMNIWRQELLSKAVIVRDAGVLDGIVSETLNAEGAAHGK